MILKKMTGFFNKKAFRKLLLKKKLIIPFIAGIMLILVPVLLLQIRNRPVAHADWFNDNWGYRKKLTLVNSGTTQNNKKVKFDIDTLALIDDDKMQTDCGDIRILNNSGNLLPHYIDDVTGACGTDSTDIWIKTGPVYAGTNTLYILRQ